MKERYSWLKGGVMLGVVFLAAVWLIKPIGVSTQYVIVDGIVWNFFSADLITKNQATNDYSSSNVYLNKSGGKYASNIENPLNYGLLFVLSMFLGGYISGRFSKKKVRGEERSYLKVWNSRFGSSILKRNFYVFVSGIMVLVGARLAGGCTSGHMMSGMMQTSLSGYLFAAGTFATAIPVAIGFSSLVLFILLSLNAIDAGHLNVKSAYVGVINGGGILGIGFAISGYCPGTGIVAAGRGRRDAPAFILGGLFGAFMYMLIFGFIKDSALFNTIAGGAISLVETNPEKYSSIAGNLSSLIIAGPLAIVFMLIAFLLPSE